MELIDMETINLYFDFEFTNLSSDAQPISLGIVSDEKRSDINTDPKILSKIILGQKQSEFFPSKTFYAEFTDFNIDHCDDWVNENVVSKLRTDTDGIQEQHLESDGIREGNFYARGDTSHVIYSLKQYLYQFRHYNIQFVCDCGTFDWFWMLQLLDERVSNEGLWMIPSACVPDGVTGSEFIQEWKKASRELGSILCDSVNVEPKLIKPIKKGLPQLPDNISPVPQDLNDLLALKLEISVKEAFNIDREGLEFGVYDKETGELEVCGTLMAEQKHNALWDAKVIKSIFNNLTKQMQLK